MKRQQAWPEERLGRITNAGRFDLRYRIPTEPIEPDDFSPMREVMHILAGVVVLLGLFVGILAWVAIGTVAQS